MPGRATLAMEPGVVFICVMLYYYVDIYTVERAGKRHWRGFEADAQYGAKQSDTRRGDELR